MAPSEPTTRKRKQPPFNPPRPGVSNATTSKKPNIGSIFSDSGKKTKSTSKPRPKAKPTKERPGVREQEVEDDDDEEEEEDDAGDSLIDDEADAEDSDGEESQEDASDASDADMMLAEITHDLPEDPPTEPAIPIPLLHRLLHHSFKDPDATKLSTDARACVAKYIETFVREGIARCAFEVNDRGNEGRSDSALGRDDGWLEVEDLERVGGQLVLDF